MLIDTIQRIMENASASVCLNELQALERTDVSCQIKLRAAAALCAATELSNDAIEVTSEEYEIQVNIPSWQALREE